MTEPAERPASADPTEGPPPKKKGRLKRMLLPVAMRYALLRRLIGIQVVYRSTGGGLIVGGLSYAALFALIPTLILVIAGIFLLVDDPQFRQDAIEVINQAFPAFTGITDTAVEGARELAAVGGLVALIGFLWGASGLYLNLTRAMERFFPGERVSGVLARVVGVLLVLLIIVGVLAVVLIAGVVTVIIHALELDSEWILTAVSSVATFGIAAAIVYAIYRVIPSNPPSARSAWLPAVLVGLAIALMTLLYSALSPLLVSSYAAFGVMASVFVALIWLRVVFLAMIYGTAMARYRDYVAAAAMLGEAEPDSYATGYALEQEAARERQDSEAAHEMERRRAAADEAATDRGPDAA